jgi:hypothetical protein
MPALPTVMQALHEYAACEPIMPAQKNIFINNFTDDTTP